MLRMWSVTWLVILGLSATVACNDDGDNGNAPADDTMDTMDVQDDTQDDEADAPQDATEEPQDVVDVQDVVPDEPDEERVFDEDPLLWPLDLPGAFRVGYRYQEVTYTSPATGAERTIGWNVWYPTEDLEGAPARYLDTTTFQDFEAFADASLAPSPYPDGRYPVHVHSHGSQGFGGTSSFLMRHFASHGWVVVAPDHTDNLINDDLSPRPTATYIHRSTDITQALDVLENLPQEDPLAGLADTSRVFMSGHSFGVFTTWASIGATFDMDLVRAQCEDGSLALGCTEQELAVFEAGLHDERVVASAPMAGTYRASWFGPDGFRSVTTPVMSLTGTQDPVGQEDQWENLADMGSLLTWVEIRGACHQSFALGFCGSLFASEGFTIINNVTLALARNIVLDDQAQATLDILDGTTRFNPNVLLQRR